MAAKKTQKTVEPTGKTEKPAREGRPSKLTPELQNQICLLIRSGNYVETAAAAAGIHKDSLYEWLKRGAAETEGAYRGFSDALKEALALSETRDIQTITLAARSQWQAAAWKLERRFAERWGRKDKIAVENDPVDWAKVPQETLDAYCDGKLSEDDVRRAIIAQAYRSAGGS